ncbi:hypothetical protein B0H66DRAFT_69338 [Apodospora peruviana]|uniref:Zn(2)-C6 fungal-type domain-containing protein n=1 Tax=Apodospora peruviana TaxID=516989 RepID=A0AAE0ITD7_9PEZI|nr:hypothetical protein B0H66DRAFT_69338 [Apodospora peruviana]
MENSNAAQEAVARPRITNACEACRSAKVKCQASNTLGICRRCLDSKRECIFKTGPRTRRPRQSRLNDPAATRLPPPPGPSKTFTIDIPMPDEGVHDVADGIEALRLSHEVSVDNLMPDDSSSEDEDQLDEYGYYSYAAGEGPQFHHQSEHTGSVASHASSLPVGASALDTPPSSVVGCSSSNRPAGSAKRTLATVGIQPQFNVDSAAALLDTFRTVMLRQFPCALIPPEATVADLAKDRPFVLLAVLAAASSSRTLKGHSLYDEEFRKILGLKFVAGGERSIELLQGLVIYVAWYPFHLRPRNKQAFQYVRMTVDIVNDLELDLDPGSNGGEVTQDRLEAIRAYLGSYYQVSKYVYGTTWNRTPSLQFTAYTAKCCDILEQNSQHQGDAILVWQVRLQRIVEETNDMRRNQRGHSQSESQIDLMLRGMEAQLTEWESKLPADLLDIPSIRIGFLFAHIFLSGAPLLKLPSRKLPSLDSATAFRADPQRLASVIRPLHIAYDYFLGLQAVEINAFTGVHWGSFILAIILGFRMSFALAVCPGWDEKEARRQLRFGEYIDRFCRSLGGDETGDSDDIQASLNAYLASGGASTQPTQLKTLDILSASKVVLGVVRKKYQRRLAKLEPPPKQQQQETQTALPTPATAPGLTLQQQPDMQQANMLAGIGMMDIPIAAPIGSSDSSSGSSPMQLDSTMVGCPMMDGSMEPYYPYWDETFTAPPLHHSHPHPQQQQMSVDGGGGGSGGGAIGGEETILPGGASVAPEQQPTTTTSGHNDLWGAMTMGWAAAQNDINFDGI